MDPPRSFATAFRQFEVPDEAQGVDAPHAGADSAPARVELSTSSTGEEAGPRYDVKSVLGRGGMGEVRLCRDERIGRDVAVKIAHAKHASQAAARARFLREARVQGQLDHPAIVPVHDLESFADGSAYFVMRRVRGATLATILADIQRGDDETIKKMPLRKLLAVLGSVCLAVDFAHRKGVVHRDIKPGNIMVGDYGEVYLLDWGLAKVTGVDDERTIDTGGLGATAATMAGSVLGTPGYMAPEQIDASVGEIGPPTDVYALGCVLFEMIAQAPYIDARDSIDATIKTLKGEERRPSLRAKHTVTAALDAVCERALARNPQDRYASARELHDEIDRYLAGEQDVERRRAQSRRHLDDAMTRPDTVAGRAEALKELGRALALDPDNAAARRDLVRLLTAPPAQVPDEVRDDLREVDAARVTQLARLSKMSGLVFVPFLPVLFAIGVRDVLTLAVSFGALGASSLMNALTERSRGKNRVTDALAHVGFVVAVLSLAHIAGMLLLIPALLVGYGVQSQMHPMRRARLGALAACCGTFVVLFILEAAGVTDWYSIVDGGLLVREGTIAINEGTIWALSLATLATIVTPALFMASVRTELAAAQQKMQVQAWQLKQIVRS